MVITGDLARSGTDESTEHGVSGCTFNPACVGQGLFISGYTDKFESTEYITRACVTVDRET